MAYQRVKLTQIPASLQEQYDIGPEVEADADDSVYGGHFEFTNRKGESIEVDAAELSGNRYTGS